MLGDFGLLGGELSQVHCGGVLLVLAVFLLLLLRVTLVRHLVQVVVKRLFLRVHRGILKLRQHMRLDRTVDDLSLGGSTSWFFASS